MTRSRGRPQIERKLAVMNTELEEPYRLWSPDPEDVEDWPFNLPIPGVGRIIGRQGLDKETGRLVEFSMTAQVQHGGQWHDTARVDTAHEEVHLHVFSANGSLLVRERLFSIYGPQDVDRGWREGEKMLVARWEEHERRWRCGR